MIRYNTDNAAIEYYTGSQWRSSGGGTGGTESNPFTSLSQADSAGVADGYIISLMDLHKTSLRW